MFRFLRRPFPMTDEEVINQALELKEITGRVKPQLEQRVFGICQMIVKDG